MPKINGRGEAVHARPDRPSDRRPRLDAIELRSRPWKERLVYAQLSTKRIKEDPRSGRTEKIWTLYRDPIRIVQMLEFLGLTERQANQSGRTFPCLLPRPPSSRAMIVQNKRTLASRYMAIKRTHRKTTKGRHITMPLGDVYAARFGVEWPIESRQVSAAWGIRLLVDSGAYRTMPRTPLPILPDVIYRDVRSINEAKALPRLLNAFGQLWDQERIWTPRRFRANGEMVMFANSRSNSFRIPWLHAACPTLGPAKIEQLFQLLRKHKVIVSQVIPANDEQKYPITVYGFGPLPREREWNSFSTVSNAVQDAKSAYESIHREKP